MTEPDSLVLQLLRNIREDIGGLDRKIDKQGDELRAEFRSELHSLRADVASDMLSLEKRLGEQIVGLRRAMVEYHSSAIGHGVLICEFEERLRRVEQRLNAIHPETH
jgi:hypothetical protein